MQTMEVLSIESAGGWLRIALKDEAGRILNTPLQGSLNTLQLVEKLAPFAIGKKVDVTIEDLKFASTTFPYANVNWGTLR